MSTPESAQSRDDVPEVYCPKCNEWVIGEYLDEVILGCPQCGWAMPLVWPPLSKEVNDAL